jgi:hypothetical protein
MNGASQKSARAPAARARGAGQSRKSCGVSYSFPVCPDTANAPRVLVHIFNRAIHSSASFPGGTARFPSSPVIIPLRRIVESFSRSKSPESNRGASAMQTTSAGESVCLGNGFSERVPFPQRSQSRLQVQSFPCHASHIMRSDPVAGKGRQALSVAGIFGSSGCDCLPLATWPKNSKRDQRAI